MISVPSIAPADFILARQAERAARVEQRLRRKADALVALHRARDAFHETAGPAADTEGDDLELIADRLLDFAATLQRDCERLDAARDHQTFRGSLAVRTRPPVVAADLAQALAETVAEAALSPQAGAVLLAAVRHAAL